MRRDKTHTCRSGPGMSRYGTMIGAGVIMLVCGLLGGLRAVAYNDVFQGAILMIGCNVCVCVCVCVCVYCGVCVVCPVPVPLPLFSLCERVP